MLVFVGTYLMNISEDDRSICKYHD